MILPVHLLLLLALVDVSQPWSLDYRVTGGIDGRNQHLTLNDTGRATVESRREGRAEFDLTPAEMTALETALHKATAVAPSSKPPEAYPDAIYTSLTLTSGGKTTKVDVATGGVGPALQSVLSRGLRLAESQKPKPQRP